MDAADQQALIEKIEALPPDLRERVEGYVDALLEGQGARTRGGEESGWTEQLGELDASNRAQAGEVESGEEGSRQEEAKVPRFQWRGALSHLADEYTAEELQEKANEWRMKKALDY